MNINLDNSIHPWRKNKKITIYDLFFSPVIACLSGYKNTGFCIGKNCPLAHIDDLYSTSLKYGLNNMFYLEPVFWCGANKNFIKWNHLEYMRYNNYVYDLDEYTNLKKEQEIFINMLNNNLYNRWIYHKLMSNYLHNELQKKN